MIRSFKIKFFRFLAETVNRFVPYDEGQSAAGVGKIKLDSSHPFNTAALTHDVESEEARLAESREMYDKADMRLFWQMALIAHNKSQADLQEGLHLAMECCHFWPIARKFNRMRALGIEQA